MRMTREGDQVKEPFGSFPVLGGEGCRNPPFVLCLGAVLCALGSARLYDRGHLEM